MPRVSHTAVDDFFKEEAQRSELIDDLVAMDMWQPREYLEIPKFGCIEVHPDYVIEYLDY
jgi:hypothetical protein